MESTSALIEMPKVGSLLGRFQLERELGQGSLGAVYLAHDTLLDTKVALKIISPSLAKTEAFSRLAREVLLARRVSHPGICRIFDIHEVNQYLFISMEYIEGPTLEELITKIGVLPNDRAARLIAYVSRSLASAHQQGVLHRGLTPSNLVVRPGDRVSVMDFGQALARDMASSTGAATPEETVHYMSPEVLTGNEATQESDIYSLGAILYRCVTGARPFQGQNVVELTNAILGGNMVPPHLFNPQVGQALEKLIQKSMAVSAQDRYRTVAEFREWLTAVTGQDAGEDEGADDPTASMGLPAGFAREAGQDGDDDEADDPADDHTQQVLMQETTLLFSDIVGITRYFDKFGDMAGRKRIQKHNQLLFPVIQRHRGRVLKTIGDAIMAYFLVPDDGVEAAIEMQQALEKVNRATSDEDARINIRIGLHTGPCIIEDQDVFGDAVNVASRVSGRADGDEILISEVTRSQLNRAKEHTEFSSETTLKGKTEEFSLFTVHWQGIELPDGPPPASLPAPPRLRPLFQAGPPTSPGVPPAAASQNASNVPSPFASPPAQGPSGTVIVGSGPGLPDMSDQPPPPAPPTGPIELIPDPVPPPEPGSERDPVLYIPDTESTTETPATVEDSFAALDAPPPAADMTALIGARQTDRSAPRPRRTGLTVLLIVGLLAVAGVGVAIGLNIGKPDGSTGAGDGIQVDPDAPLISKDDLKSHPQPVDAAKADPEVREPVGEPDPKADPEPDPRPRNTDVAVAPVRPKPSRNTTGELNRQKKAVWASMRKRGILSGDSPKLDAELKRMKRNARKNKLAAAIGAARRAQGMIRDLEIDRAFIQAKLLRFNRAFDQAGDSPAAERVGAMAGDIMTAVESGRYERANALLNKAFKTLREGR